jgi:hypothetical protein
MQGDDAMNVLRFRGADKVDGVDGVDQDGAAVPAAAATLSDDSRRYLVGMVRAAIARPVMTAHAIRTKFGWAPMSKEWPGSARLVQFAASSSFYEGAESVPVAVIPGDTLKAMDDLLHDMAVVIERCRVMEERASEEWRRVPAPKITVLMNGAGGHEDGWFELSGVDADGVYPIAGCVLWHWVDAMNSLRSEVVRLRAANAELRKPMGYWYGQNPEPIFAEEREGVSMETLEDWANDGDFDEGDVIALDGYRMTGQDRFVVRKETHPEDDGLLVTKLERLND